MLVATKLYRFRELCCLLPWKFILSAAFSINSCVTSNSETVVLVTEMVCVGTVAIAIPDFYSHVKHTRLAFERVRACHWLEAIAADFAHPGVATVVLNSAGFAAVHCHNSASSAGAALGWIRDAEHVLSAVLAAKHSVEKHGFLTVV